MCEPLLPPVAEDEENNDCLLHILQFITHTHTHTQSCIPDLKKQLSSTLFFVNLSLTLKHVFTLRIHDLLHDCFLCVFIRRTHLFIM